MPRVLFPPLFCLFQSNAIDAQKNIKGPFFLGRKRIKSWKLQLGCICHSKVIYIIRATTLQPCSIFRSTVPP